MKIVHTIEIFFIHYWIIFATAFLMWIMYGVVAAVGEAYLDVKNRKKEEMFWCSACKTFFKKEYALQLFPELRGIPENSWVCPMCYYKTVFSIPNKKLGVS